MSAPTSAWLTAASAPDADPTFIFQIPDVGTGLYFSSKPDHYPVGMASGGNEYFHDGIIREGGLPTITRELQSPPLGPRVVSTIGDIRISNNSEWDAYIADYASTIRGKIINGWVTFDGLAVTDAVQFLTARIDRVSINADETVLSLVDSVTEQLDAVRLAAGTFTSAKLGDVVKARLTAGGLSYPADFDTIAWNAWIAAGEPGDYTFTGTWSEGRALDIVNTLLTEALSYFSITRDGKFFVEKFSDLGVSPTVDVALTDTNALFEGAATEIFSPVFRSQTVKYNAGANSVTKTSTVSTGHVWWPTAKEGEPKDIGIDGVTDATSLATDRLALLSAEHLITTIATDTRMLAFNVGDVVELDFSLHKLPSVSTNYHRVISLSENPNSGETVLKLWTSLGATP